MQRRWGLNLIAVALVVTTSRDASADWDFQFATSVGGAWLRETPALDSEAVSLTSRRIGEGQLRSRGGLAMLGFGMDTEFTIDDRWKVPLAGYNAWWATGNYDAVNTSFDGSIAQTKPWSAYRIDILLPGFGRRIKLRRNLVSFTLRAGASRLKMDGTVADGAGVADLELTRWTFLAQIELEACRRLDPTTRICLQVVPRIYEHEFMNGLTVGLRMEWGR